MFHLIFIALAVAAAAGLIAKFFLDRANVTEEITWKEFAIGMVAIAFLVVPGVTKAGWEISKSNLVSYNEYWNGWEIETPREDILCERDGSCIHDYDCDPYIVIVSYSCGKDGRDTCYRPETRYHSCPYADVETNYTVKTTLGDFDIDRHRLPANPQSHRWRQSESIPDYVIEDAGAGIPPFWKAAHARIQANAPGPVNVRKGYENYILASDRTILKQYSGDIQRFQSAGLLPKLNSGIRDFYLADKVYFIGYQPNDASAWQSKVGYLDAALGSELQGDLHLVIVRNDLISGNPDVYALALKAYWQDTKVFGRDALSKNGIGVIVGTTDGTTVAWARAFTGMPLGNEAMEVALRERLKNLPLTPESVIGNVKGNISVANGKFKVTSDHEKGALESVLWGLEDPSTKFKRYSMSGKSGIGAGFLYLKGEIQPTTGQQIMIFIVAFILSGGVWVACAFIGERNFKQKRFRTKYS